MNIAIALYKIKESNCKKRLLPNNILLKGNSDIAYIDSDTSQYNLYHRDNFSEEYNLGILLYFIETGENPKYGPVKYSNSLVPHSNNIRFLIDALTIDPPIITIEDFIYFYNSSPLVFSGSTSVNKYKKVDEQIIHNIIINSSKEMYIDKLMNMFFEFATPSLNELYSSNLIKHIAIGEKEIQLFKLISFTQSYYSVLFYLPDVFKYPGLFEANRDMYPEAIFFYATDLTDEIQRSIFNFKPYFKYLNELNDNDLAELYYAIPCDTEYNEYRINFLLSIEDLSVLTSENLDCNLLGPALGLCQNSSDPYELSLYVRISFLYKKMIFGNPLYRSNERLNDIYHLFRDSLDNKDSYGSLFFSCNYCFADSEAYDLTDFATDFYKLFYDRPEKSSRLMCDLLSYYTEGKTYQDIKWKDFFEKTKTILKQSILKAYKIKML